MVVEKIIIPEDPDFEAFMDEIVVENGLPRRQFPNPVRMRPGMYIGDTGVRGLHHLFKEIVDNSVEEVIKGYATQIDVVLAEDYTLSMSDNGRGIPVHVLSEVGKTAIEYVFTDFKWPTRVDVHGDSSQRIYEGLRGVGAASVNALSDLLECVVKRAGNVYRMRFERGFPVTPLEIIGSCEAGEQGTSVTWLADKTLFQPALTDTGNLAYDGELIARQLRELSYHLPNAHLTFHNRLNNQPLQTFHSPDGASDFVRYLNQGQNCIPISPIAISGAKGDVRVAIALQYGDRDSNTIHGFANTLPTVENGTHITGFLRVLTRAMNGLGTVRTKYKGKTVQSCLTAVVLFFLPNPCWHGASKDRLSNPELDGIVFSIAYTGLQQYFQENPEQAQAIHARFAENENHSLA